VAKVIGTAAVAAFTRHRVQPAGGQAGKLGQRIVDERQIRIDQRTTGGPNPGQPGLSQDAGHGLSLHPLSHSGFDL
jgi:hypothetical protein